MRRAGWDDLVGAIYETSLFPDRWPVTLDKIARWVGAVGGNLIRSTGTSLDMISSSPIEEIAREFDALGWNERNTRVSRLLENGSHPGFLTDSHLHTAEELTTLPMYTEFLNPRGAAAGAGTLIQGARDDAVILTVEAFPSHEASRASVAALDRLRPHLARSAVLASQLEVAREASTLAAFDALGTAIALLDRTGKAIGMSQRFAADTAELISDGPIRLRMHDAETDRRFALALVGLERQKTGMSIALRNREKSGAAVLHLIPARRDARELFSRVTTFAVLARSGNALLPSTNILAALFDLTPAEAKVARAVAEGLAPAEIARKTGVSSETVRSQLKRVFAKTSTSRQSELSLLISKLT